MICEPCYHPYFKPGDKIFKTNSALAESQKKDSDAKEEKRYGTLGGFVTDKNSNTYALTCSHICTNEGRCVFAAHGDSERENIGECAFSSNLQAKQIPIFADVALVKINDEVKERCKRSMLNDDLSESKVKIFSGNLENFVRRDYVYKFGATTGLTKGYVLSPAFYITGRDETFLVSGFGDVHFAERGDSGSIVLMNKNDSALDTINVIGMFFGSCTLNDDKNKTTKKKDEEIKKKKEDCKEKSACFRMDTALQFLRQNGWDINFEDQI